MSPSLMKELYSLRRTVVGQVGSKGQITLYLNHLPKSVRVCVNRVSCVKTLHTARISGAPNKMDLCIE